MHLPYLLQLSLFVTLTLLLARYVASILALALTPREFPFFAIALSWIENAFYKILHVDREKKHTWKEYALYSFLITIVSSAFVILILTTQDIHPFNPQKFSSLPFPLALSIAVSFATNTDWQCYVGESSLTQFSQMAALTVQNFVSASVSLAGSAALVRALVAERSTFLGNFWVDITRIILYVLLPLSVLFATLFILEGSPQNTNPYTEAITLEGHKQTIVQGPIASQEAIKLLASNGGGYTAANSAHPYENPTAPSCYLQMLCMMLLPCAQLFYFGKSIKKTKHIWSIFLVLFLLFISATLWLSAIESSGNPLLSLFQISPEMGNMEGKEVRFGSMGSSVFSAISSATSNGSICSSITSYMPLAGMICLINILFGQTLFGSVGSGLQAIIFTLILARYLSSLMSGKKGEYLGKKLSIFDIKITMIAVFSFVALIMLSTSLFITSSWGTKGMITAGPHGFTEVFYTIGSAASGNGSILIPPAAITTSYQWVLSALMLLSRLSMISLSLALAGSLARKGAFHQPEKSLPYSGIAFCLVLLFVILLMGSMSFLPGLVIGPIFESLLIDQGRTL